MSKKQFRIDLALSWPWGDLQDNIANVPTPGYKRSRGVSFTEFLEQEEFLGEKRVKQIDTRSTAFEAQLAEYRARQQARYMQIIEQNRSHPNP